METVKNAVDREIPEGYADQYDVFEGQYACKNEYKKAAGKVVPALPSETKLVSSLREAIEKPGLKDGMTISFHHHFRKGNYVLNMIMKEITEMGVKNLKLAADSITNVHEPLIEHIKGGVIIEIANSGLRDEAGSAVSHGLMEKSIVIRSHDGRAHAIESGEIHIGATFLGASSADPYGNANGPQGNATYDSLGYAKIDTEYADKIVIITDYLVDYPNTPINISQALMGYIVVVDTIGNPGGIAKGATRFTSDPKKLLIAENACEVIIASPYFKDGISFQSGSGDSALAVTRFLTEKMRENGITAGYLLGGITNNMVKLLEEDLAKRILDTQTFSHGAATLIARNENHYEISASFYVNPGNKGAAVNQLDVVMLPALGVDTDFNVNVMAGSNNVIRGISGGHSGTTAGAKLSLILCPLLRERISTIVEQVNTVITPGEGVDVTVTEVGIAMNPRRKDLQEALKNAGMNFFTMGELKNKACALVGTPDPIEYGDKVMALIEHRDGSLVDVVRQVKRRDERGRNIHAWRDPRA